jgi:hypothetical protein
MAWPWLLHSMSLLYLQQVSGGSKISVILELGQSAGGNPEYIRNLERADLSPTYPKPVLIISARACRLPSNQTRR